MIALFAQGYSVPFANASDLLSGYLQATDTQQFLTCDSKNCRFTDNQNEALSFKRETGHDGQYKFVTGDRCLDREHCHSSTSNARLSDCNHCGSYHWQLLPDGKLAEDGGANCIINDGSIKHCSDSFQPVAFYEVTPPFNPPKGSWKHAGYVASGTLSNTFEWGTSSADTHALTSTWAESLTASFKEGVIFESAKISATVSTSIANMMSTTFTQETSTTCKVTCPAQAGKPFIFLFQWLTESTHVGEAPSQVTEAKSCNYMCIYQEHDGQPTPKCPLTCCYDVDCQTCTSECYE